MVDKTQNWSSNWKSSKNPSKQRKYRRNAPLHVKDKLISANMDQDLREELETRNITVRTGDRAKVMRGDHKGREGIISRIDRDNAVVFIDGVENERQDGSKSLVPIRPSNIQLTALNVDDLSRIEKYDVEDVESIKVDEEELEVLEEDEEGEMMQRMQDQAETEETEEDEESEEEPTEETETEETESTETNYEEIVSENIGDVKDALKDLDEPDYEAALEAEKAGKNRKTLVEYLENKKED